MRVISTEEILDYGVIRMNFRVEKSDDFGQKISPLRIATVEMIVRESIASVEMRRKGGNSLFSFTFYTARLGYSSTLA